MTVDDTEPVDKPRRRRVRSPVAVDARKTHDEKDAGRLSNDNMAQMLEFIAKNPDNAIRKLAKAEGFPHHATERFINRLRVNHVGLTTAVRQLSRKQELDTMSEKIAKAFEYMDDYTFANADLKDLAIFFGIMVEKRELMSGRPTMIMSFEERRHLSDLLPAYVAEARRRGITIDQTAVEVHDEIRPRTFLPDEVREEVLSHTARHDVVTKRPAEER